MIDPSDGIQIVWSQRVLSNFACLWVSLGNNEHFKLDVINTGKGPQMEGRGVAGVSGPDSST
jgi:hypothetical protein